MQIKFQFVQLLWFVAWSSVIIQTHSFQPRERAISCLPRFLGSHQSTRSYYYSSLTRCSLNSPEGGGGYVERTSNHQYDNEEILLQMHLSVQAGYTVEEAVDRVAQYSQFFPFAIVLPVQPLTYVPKDRGVELQFLRKKTDDKPSVDGGIRFFVQPLLLDFNDNDVDEDGVFRNIKNNEDDLGANGVQIVAKRNSVGQTIPKLVAERLVITSFVAGITGDNNNGTSTTQRFGTPPIDVVQVQSIFHKWM